MLWWWCCATDGGETGAAARVEPVHPLPKLGPHSVVHFELSDESDEEEEEEVLLDFDGQEKLAFGCSDDDLQTLKPDHFEIVLAKASETDKLGLDIAARTGSDSEPPVLKIKAIKPGLVSEWNIHHPDRSVQVGDIIVSINGRHSDDKSMYAAISSAPTLAMMLRRPNFSL